MNTVWLYGRSGAGKTTLARRLCADLQKLGITTLLLDGDQIRHGLGRDLRFDSASRIENHRRIAEVARLAADQGIQPVVATMAPEHVQRDAVTKVLGTRLDWILVHAPIEVCAARDPKGLYRQAREGNLGLFLDFPFDPPRPGEDRHVIDTSRLDIDTAAAAILGIASPISTA